MHRLIYTSSWFSSNSLQWPENSSNLDIFKIIWRPTVRLVYQNENQYANIDDLGEAIGEVWQSLDASNTWNLSHSI